VITRIHRGRAVIAVDQLESDGDATGVIEQPDAVAEQHWREVQVDLVDQSAL